jgi:alcohol dehydrogenase-like protein
MRITAAVTRNARGPFSIESLELEEPRTDEILVRIIAAGLSHTDLLARDQDLPVSLPAVLGREGAGRVERVGAQVTEFAPGDRVILTQPATADKGLLYEADLLGSQPVRIKTRRLVTAAPQCRADRGCLFRPIVLGDPCARNRAQRGQDRRGCSVHDSRAAWRGRANRGGGRHQHVAAASWLCHRDLWCWSGRAECRDGRTPLRVSPDYRCRHQGQSAAASGKHRRDAHD